MHALRLTPSNLYMQIVINCGSISEQTELGVLNTYTNQASLQHFMATVLRYQERVFASVCGFIVGCFSCHTQLGDLICDFYSAAPILPCI